MDRIADGHGCTVVVATQICDRNGVRRSDASTVRRLRQAAARLTEHMPGSLAAPGVVSQDGVLTLAPAAAELVVDLLLRVADATRPEKTTFCVTLTPKPDPTNLSVHENTESAEHGSPQSSALDAAVLSSHAADTLARDALSQTDYRDTRVVVLAAQNQTLLATLLDLLLEAYDAMTERQRQIIQLVNSNRTQQDVATHLGISRQAVNQSLASARWPHLDRAARRVTSRLNQLCAGTSGVGGGESPQ